MLLIRSQFPFFLFLIFSFSVFSCEDNPLYIEDKDLSLKIDTVSFVVTESITYQTPPIMGGSKRLYLGRSENYDFEYAMIRFNNTASRRFDPQGNRNIIDNFIDYNDSLLTIDSLGLKLFSRQIQFRLIRHLNFIIIQMALILCLVRLKQIITIIMQISLM